MSWLIAFDIAEPKTIAQLRDLNMEPRRLTPDPIQKMVREESAFFADLIRTAKSVTLAWRNAEHLCRRLDRKP